MSDKTETETITPDADTLSRTDRIFIRISMWQTILAVAGMVTGLIALYAALNESAAVRRQSASAVWPMVQLTTNDFITDEDQLYSISMTNVGVGPAKVRSMEVTIRGEKVANWREATQVLVPEFAGDISQSSVIGRVMSPGESIDLFVVRDRALVTDLLKAAREGEARVRWCYCSIFDDCWLADTAAGSADPEEVKVCPDFGDEAFTY